MTITLSRATAGDLPRLRDLAVAAFAVDERDKPAGARQGVPPGSDDLATHRQWLQQMDYYTCTRDGRLVGSCTVHTRGGCGFIHGIQVLPAAMGQGIGSRILADVKRRYPGIHTWELETPDYARRNHRFYEKNGFSRVAVTPADPALGFGFYTYRKIIPAD